MNSFPRLGAALVLTALLPACGEDGPPASARAAFTVGAAASLAPLVEEALGVWEARGGSPGRATFGASSTISRQIEDGAPVDLFASADERWVDMLALRGHLRPGTERVLVRNGLVLAFAEGAPGPEVALRPDRPAPEVLAGARWASGDPDHVPLGLRARETLERLGWWEALAPGLVPCADARAALRLLERGEVDWALLYASDARASPAVGATVPVPVDLHGPVIYPAALTRHAGPEARAFLDWLSGDEGQALATAHGFLSADTR